MTGRWKREAGCSRWVAASKKRKRVEQLEKQAIEKGRGGIPNRVVTESAKVAAEKRRRWEGGGEEERREETRRKRGKHGEQ